MWNFASSCIAGSIGLKKDPQKPAQTASECSDDEVSSVVGREEGLECPICCESFNLVENVPYVLWCGHTLCKNCILGLQWAVVKFPTLPIQLPLFISCPWCNLLSFRLVYRGNLKFPHKNYFLLWMVESMNGERVKTHSSQSEDHHPSWSVNGSTSMACQISSGSNLRRGHHVHHSEPSRSNERVHLSNYLSLERLNSSLKITAFLRSFDGQVSVGCDIPSNHHICYSSKCSDTGFVHTHHSFVCPSVVSHIVLCIS